MRQKIIAAALGIGLVAIAAIGAYASQDSVTTQADTPTATGTVDATEPATDTATATEQATDTPAETDTPQPTETPEATDTSIPEATETSTPQPTDTPTPGAGNCDGNHEGGDEDDGGTQATVTPSSGTGDCSGEDHSERDVKGIPSDNPSHHADDGDGECEKGETAVKTTPSGVQVNVPCQAAEHSNKEHENGNGGS